MVVYWAVENNLVYFAKKRRLICDCDSFSGLSYVEYYKIVYFFARKVQL